MAINGTKKITELDFEEIRTNLQTYLESQDRFKDYDFNGSGLSILLDTLAYNTHYQAYYTNMVANEMFLDSAVKRESVVSHAKQIGYTPHSRKSPEATVQISFSSASGDTITVPSRTEFSTTINGNTLKFYNTTPVTIGATGTAPYVSDTFSVYEGTFSSISYVVSSTSETKYVIPTDRIDTDHMTVRVLTSTTDTSGSNDVWSKATDITGITAGSKVYFLEENPKGFYEIKFGDNIIGQKLVDGNVVIIEYLETNGVAANRVGRSDSSANRTFSTSLANSEVSVVTSASGGSDSESVESIRQNSPLFYQTQDRAVTENDYKSLILANYGDSDDVAVFGGENYDPPQYGRVYVSVKPASGGILTETEKENIKRDILRTKNIVGIIPDIIDPEYTYLKYNAKFSYDKTMTTSSPETLKNTILVYLSLYSNVFLSKFGKNLYVNRLEELCRELDPSLNYVDVDLKLEKRLAPNLNKKNNYVIRFENSILNTIHTATDGVNGPPAVQSSSFAYKKNDNTIFLAAIDSDMDGNLRIYEVVSGVRVTVFDNIGSIDFSNGVVTINDFSPLSATKDGTIRFEVTPIEDVIYTVTNNILDFDSSDTDNLKVLYVEDRNTTDSVPVRTVSSSVSTTSTSSSSSSSSSGY